MRILLDTHTLLWAAKGSLDSDVQSILEDTAHELYFSPVNLWEIGFKRSKLSIDLKALHHNLIRNGYLELGLASRHVLCLAQLPLLHTDPFDRILLAQAYSEHLFLLTSDEALKQYRSQVDCILGFD